MDTSFKSPQILAILSDYYDAIVPEGQLAGTALYLYIYKLI